MSALALIANILPTFVDNSVLRSRLLAIDPLPKTGISKSEFLGSISSLSKLGTN